MIHRNPYPPYVSDTDHLGGDPWDSSETNPALTRAIDSSLWELDTLRTHYHPTIAGVARIVAEQFTKRSYNVEDFLDHGYASLMRTELDRDLSMRAEGNEDDDEGGRRRGSRDRRERRKRNRKETVVEYKIPKRIFSREEGEGAVQKEKNYLLELWKF